jgi:hypothetical protein
MNIAAGTAANKGDGMAFRAMSTLLTSVSLLVCAGCASHSPEDAIRHRFEQFITSCQSGDIEAAIELVDPAVVSQRGLEGLKQHLRGFSKLLHRQSLRVDKVTVAPDGKTAEVSHSMRTQDGNWLSQVPYGSWVKIDKKWYFRERGFSGS